MPKKWNSSAQISLLLYKTGHVRLATKPESERNNCIYTMTEMTLSSQHDLLPASSSSPCALLEGQSSTKDVFIYLSAETGNQDLRYKKHEWQSLAATCGPNGEQGLDIRHSVGWHTLTAMEIHYDNDDDNNR
jgi:hypothetical protein